MNVQLEIQLIAALTAAACAIPGVFLMLRGLSMLADAITHTILLGIVLAFFVTQSLTSPLLLVGAALMGVVTVWLTELLCGTRLLAKDTAIGVVFPFLFSVAVLLICRYTGSVHLDTDAVLLGELAFAPFDRLVVAGADIGARAVYVTGGLLLLNAAAMLLFFKESKLAAFDPVLAAVLGFSPVLLHYGLVTLVSLTAVGAFQAVGSVLVAAFLIGPPATAYLLTDHLPRLVWLSVLVGVASALLGYRAAIWLDVSIAGAMAVCVGVFFLLAAVLSPKKGFFLLLLTRKKRLRAIVEGMRENKTEQTSEKVEENRI